MFKNISAQVVVMLL